MKKLIMACICLGILISCGPFPLEIPLIDLNPPVFLHWERFEEKSITLHFDEPVQVEFQSLSIKPALDIEDIRVEGNSVFLTLGIQDVGEEYFVFLDARDKAGNSSNLEICFYGYNPHPPKVVINEFITKGTKTHPDLVELLVIEGGDMGGLTLYNGTPGNWKERFIFPSFDVIPGDFILVHFKPQGILEEVDETDLKNVSLGLDASDNAYDFWLPGGTGLGSNNGVISLHRSPSGEGVIDGVIYSNRTAESDEKYGGFGSRTNLERAEELIGEGAWSSAGQILIPEDCVDPSFSTTTRSICRDSTGTDNDEAADWHIVPTRGSTFGEPNIDDVYVK